MGLQCDLGHTWPAQLGLLCETFATIRLQHSRAVRALIGAVEQRVFTALGGDCELFRVGVGAGTLAEAESWVHQMHDRFTRFSESSELSHFNAAAGHWTPVSSELAALLREALRAHDVSGGLVHAATLPALLAAGYTRDFSLGSTPTAKAPPPSAPLPELLQVRGDSARLAPGTAIDLGGIAKGWFADRLAQGLGENALVNLCGDLHARGPGETGQGWPVGFGDKTVLLKDVAAATSGVTKRMWGPGLHHLIDPRTSRPAVTDLREVSVLARTATDAEIYAKVALLLGSQEAPKWLEGRALGWSLV
jgi:thiamine biosynthesis lipoprotein